MYAKAYVSTLSNDFIAEEKDGIIPSIQSVTTKRLTHAEPRISYVILAFGATVVA